VSRHALPPGRGVPEGGAIARRRGITETGRDQSRARAATRTRDGWLGRCRRLAKDVEATVTSAVAWVLIAHIRLLTQGGSQDLDTKQLMPGQTLSTLA
jgi:transposase